MEGVGLPFNFKSLLIRAYLMGYVSKFTDEFQVTVSGYKSSKLAMRIISPVILN